ncbi:MAG: family 10 glycosylhydrolase [Oscillospiraceae bacterium]|nr:family 10 glycosylhydrolase [Oscillospiraceae bacterium]
MKVVKGTMALMISIVIMLSVPFNSRAAANYSSNTQSVMKAVWVSYIDLSMNTWDKSFSAFKNKFDKIVNNSKTRGFNTLIVQVRPFNDALYKSKFFPVSHILTGKQGAKIDYDPLEYMVKKIHQSGMSIHAWINPYRVRLNNQPKYLSGNNPYKKNKSIGVKWKNDVYLNPALKRTTNLIVKGVKEIVKNYDVDGVQFDDYFYPTTSAKFDKTQYTKYKNSVKNPKSLSKWRFSKINNMVKRVYNSIKEINPRVQFGISPQGYYDNNKYLYADVKTWCEKKGYIDYICPQLYWGIENKGSVTFDRAMIPWTKLKLHNGLKFYVGLAGYKAGSKKADKGAWRSKSNVLAREYRKALNKYNANGVSVFRYENTVSKRAKGEINNLTKEFNK